MFPKLPPENALDAAVMIIDKGSTLGVQTMLNTLGAGIAADGIWGKKTTAIVTRYQALRGLPAHGWTDSLTYADLVADSTLIPVQDRVKLGE